MESKEKRVILSISEAFSYKPVSLTIGTTFRIDWGSATNFANQLLYLQLTIKWKKRTIVRIEEEYKNELGQPSYLVLRGYDIENRLLFEYPSRAYNINYGYVETESLNTQKD